MELEAYLDGREYYLCRPGSRAGLRWQWQEDAWTVSRASRPAGATPVELSALPADLQEEFLALAARAAAMGEPLWGGPTDPGRDRRG